MKHFTIFKSVNLAKTTIHFQNSTRSITIHLPEFLFRASSWIKVVVLIGVALFAIQFVSISLYDGLLSQGLSSRRGLDRDLTKIQETVDYLSMTSDDFYRDERRLHARYGLPVPDEGTREMGTGGEIASDSLLLRGMSPVLEKAGLLGYFNFTLGGDLLEKKKPDPAPFYYVCSELGVVPGECVMVGDSSNDIIGARRSGMISIGLTYGYNRGRPVSESSPDYVFDDFALIGELVRGFDQEFINEENCF